MSLAEESLSPRVQPFYCPWCGEEDFVPSGSRRDQYHCRSCDRRYTVTFLGIGAAIEDAAPADRTKKWSSDTR